MSREDFRELHSFHWRYLTGHLACAPICARSYHLRQNEWRTVDRRLARHSAHVKNATKHFRGDRGFGRAIGNDRTALQYDDPVRKSCG